MIIERDKYLGKRYTLATPPLGLTGVWRLTAFNGEYCTLKLEIGEYRPLTERRKINRDLIKHCLVSEVLEAINQGVLIEV